MQVLRLDCEGAPQLLTGFLEKPVPQGAHGGLVVDGVIVAEHEDLGLSALDPAIRLAAAVRLLEQARPVGDGPEEEAKVDQVEAVVSECPFLRAVVNLELEVRRDPFRLDRREVGTDDLALGVLVGEITAWELADGRPRATSHRQGTTCIAQIPACVVLAEGVCLCRQIVRGSFVPVPVPISSTFYDKVSCGHVYVPNP